MLICPNVNMPEWIALEKAVGRFEAFRDFMQHNGEIRNPQQVLDKLRTEGRAGMEGVKYSKVDPESAPELKEEVAKSLMEFLEKKFPGIKGVVINDKNKQWKGKLEGQTPIINLAYAQMSDGFHEFAHPFLMALRKSNTKAFDSLFNDLMETPEWDEIKKRAVSRVERLYPELKKGSIMLFKEEILATAIGYAAEKQSVELQQSISKKLGKVIADLFKWLNDFFIEFLSVYKSTNQLTPTTTFAEVVDMLTDTKTRILLDQNWDKLVEASEAADAMADAVTTDYNSISAKLENDLQAAIIVNRAFDMDQFIDQWIKKNFKLPARAYKPRKMNISETITNLASNMLQSAVNKRFQLSGYDIQKTEASKEKEEDEGLPVPFKVSASAINKLAEALSSIDLNFKFGSYLNTKKNVPVSMNQPFVTVKQVEAVDKNGQPFIQTKVSIPMSLTEAEAVNEFQEVMKAKFPGRKSIPADELALEYTTWAQDNYGINWIEASAHHGYGMDRFLTPDGNMDSYTRILFMDDYFHKQGHGFAIKGTDLNGNGLGWYASVVVNGNRFDHEFQSDILPEIHKAFEEGVYESTDAIKKKNIPRVGKIKELAQSKLMRMINGTPDRLILSTGLRNKITELDPENAMPGLREEFPEQLQRDETDEMELPFSKIDDIDHFQLARAQEILLSELDVQIEELKGSRYRTRLNNIPYFKASLKVYNLFLGRKSAEQTELFEWIKTLEVAPHSIKPTSDDLDLDLPFSKTEEGQPFRKKLVTKYNKQGEPTYDVYLTAASLEKAPSFISKMVKISNEWKDSNAPIKPSEEITERDLIERAASAVAYNLLDSEGKLVKNYGKYRKVAQRVRDIQKTELDKVFKSYKFAMSSLKGFEWRKEVYKNPNNILKIAEYYKGQYNRLFKFYETIFDQAEAEAKSRETKGGERDPNYKRYKKYNDLYYKWFDIVIHQSINSAKAEGRDHYYLPTAKAMNSIEGNSAAEKVYWSPADNEREIVISSYEDAADLMDSIARYITQNTPETAQVVGPYLTPAVREQFQITQTSTPMDVAEALLYGGTNFHTNAEFAKWKLSQGPALPVKPNGPFYNSLISIAKKNNIKLTFEKPSWSSQTLIKADLSAYTPKPIDRFSKVDVDVYKNGAKNIIRQHFGTTYLKKGDISANQLASVNAALSRFNNGGDVNWKLRLSKKGFYYLAGYKDWAVLEDNYYSPYGPYRTSSNFRDDQPTGSVVELNTQMRETYPLDTESNNKAEAIEMARELAQGLSEQLGVNYQIVSEEDARTITAGTTNPWNGEAGFFLGDTVYFVGDRMRRDIVLHEFAHPLVRSIKLTNEKLFNSLYTKLEATQEGRAIISKVKALYPDLAPDGAMFKEEVMVRALVEAAALDKAPVKEPVGFAKFIKDLLFAMKQILRRVFGQKIDVSKLNAGTTLKEIADMLVKGGNFQIEVDAVTEQDTVAYIKDQRDYIDDLLKVRKPELFALTTRAHDIAIKHIEVVQNNKNFEEMLHILADEYGSGDLQEMRKNLSQYANTLSNRLDEIKDEIQYNKNHASAFVDTMFRLESMTKKIYAHMEDLTTDTDNVNNLHKAFYYDYLLKYWSGFIAEAKEALDEQKVPADSPMYQLITNIDTNIEKSFKISHGMAANGVKDVLYAELMPMASNIDARYTEIIANLKKRGASQEIIDKWVTEYTGLNEAENKRFEELKKAKETRGLTGALRTEYDRLERQSFNGAKLTPEKLDQALKGTLGDANAFNSFFEGYLYNTDPVVGGFALYVKNNMTDVLTKAQAKFNTFASDMGPLLKAAGYNPANVSGLASKITHVQEVGKVENEQFVSRKVLTFLSPYKDYRVVVDKLRFDIQQAEKQYSLTGSEEDQKKMIDAISALKTLERDYFHQEFVPEYYKMQGTLERDELGKKAAYMRDEIIERIKQENRSIETETDVMKVGEKIDALWAEYRQLHSLYDLSGKKKTGEPLAIAERLREYKEASREFYEWKERKGAFQNALKAYEQELVNAGFPADSDTFKVMRNEWIERNTRTVVKQTFYERRQLIIDRIAEIMSKLSARAKEQVDISPLLKAINDIAYTYRDDDNQPNGQAMTEESIQEVKELEEQIIKAREKLAGLNGLTPAESAELSSYFKTIKDREKLEPAERDRMEMLLKKRDMEGLPNLAKKEMFKLFAELDEMQRKEATDYYVDIMNDWLGKMDVSGIPELEGVGIINKVTANSILDPKIISELKSQNSEFARWFDKNHILKSKRDQTGSTVTYWERIHVWNVVRPTDPADYESTDILDEQGNVVETIQAAPSTRFFVRRVKPEYRTKRVVGKTTDNRGNWLPRLDVQDRRFINEDYFKLQKEDPKLFKVLEKMTEHHLQNQEGLGYKSRLYLDVPRFRKTALELIQTRGLQKSLKSAVAGRLPLLTILVKRLKLFWQRSRDPQEQGLNPSLEKDDFMLVRADMFDNEVSSVPIAGLYDIDIDDVSTDITHSMMRYMLSAERQKKLIEISPVAQALKSVVDNEKTQVKDLNSVNRFNFINRGIITYLNKKGVNTRRSAVNNMIEREFEGQTNTGMMADVPWLNNTAQLIFKRASFGFFALNLPSALKNTLGAKFQGMIEAAGGKYMNSRDFFGRGETWAFRTMGQISFEIYKKGPKSLNIQITEIFDAIQGRFEEKFGESMSRTLASDTANLSWLYNFRKWTEQQATLQSFAAMMYHQKVKQNGNEISYMDAWEIRDGKIQLKEGIDPEWGITYDADGNMKVGAQFKAMKNRIHQVINSLNGAYASFDQPEAQRYLAFRFVSFLRRYFTAMAVNRWGFSGGFGKARGRMNPGLGDVNEGYYITVMKTLNRMVTTDMKYLAFMTKDEKRAWLKFTVELMALIAISSLAVPMLGWDEDDKEKYEKLRKRSGSMPFLGLAPEDPDHPFDGYGFLENHLLNLAMQVRSENEQFVPWPNFGLDDYTGMLDLKSLATGPTLKAYKQMFTVGLDQVTGDPSAYYKRSIGPYEWQQEGGSKFLNYLFKALGLTGSSIDPVTSIKNAQGIIIRGK